MLRKALAKKQIKTNKQNKSLEFEWIVLSCLLSNSKTKYENKGALKGFAVENQSKSTKYQKWVGMSSQFNSIDIAHMWDSLQNHTH